MLKMICFDMDGTIADLYGVPNWLELLRMYSPAPFAIANPLLDMRDLADLLYAIRARGVEIRVITWLSKETNDEYDKKVAETKREWLQSYGLPIDHFHAISYGTPKADVVRSALKADETAIIFDDDVRVLTNWDLDEYPTKIAKGAIQMNENVVNAVCLTGLAGVNCTEM